MKITKYLCIALGISAVWITCIGSLYFSRAVVNSEKYPVMGVDVSHYQGHIDWNKLAEQNVSFAFIKATEGSGMIDESVKYNLKAADDTDIKISAYHFFSFDSSGETQAENFISTVEKESIDMPPVIDIEYYGDKACNKPDSADMEKILIPLLSALENYYGVKPIIYTTTPVYFRYLHGKFSDYPLWIRNVNFEPAFIDWKFWQYSDKGELYGFRGDEKYIDLNVYNGSEKDFLEEFCSGFKEVN